MEEAPSKSVKSQIDIHPATRYLSKNNEKEFTEIPYIVKPHLNFTKAFMCGLAYLFLLTAINSA